MESHRRHVDIDMKAYKVEKFRQKSPKLGIILSEFLYFVFSDVHEAQNREIPTDNTPIGHHFVGISLFCATYDSSPSK